VPTGTVLGTVTDHAAEATGLPRSCRVVSGCFGHDAVARASGACTSGTLLLSCGTSWVAFLPIDKRDWALRRGLLVDTFLSPAGPWGALFALTGIGRAVSTFAERCFGGSHGEILARLERALEAEMDNGPLLPLPIWEGPDALIDELTENNRPDAQRWRDLFECILFEVRYRLEAHAPIGPLGRLAMAGGPSHSDVVAHMTADIRAAHVVRTLQQTTAIGIGPPFAGMGDFAVPGVVVDHPSDRFEHAVRG
jgi:sugar (pentulose or hexulose) kinase